MGFPEYTSRVPTPWALIAVPMSGGLAGIWPIPPIFVVSTACVTTRPSRRPSLARQRGEAATRLAAWARAGGSSCPCLSGRRRPWAARQLPAGTVLPTCWQGQCRPRAVRRLQAGTAWTIFDRASCAQYGLKIFCKLF